MFNPTYTLASPGVLFSMATASLLNLHAPQSRPSTVKVSLRTRDPEARYRPLSASGLRVHGVLVVHGAVRGMDYEQIVGFAYGAL